MILVLEKEPLKASVIDSIFTSMIGLVVLKIKSVDVRTQNFQIIN